MPLEQRDKEGRGEGKGEKKGEEERSERVRKIRNDANRTSNYTTPYDVWVFHAKAAEGGNRGVKEKRRQERGRKMGRGREWQEEGQARKHRAFRDT